MIRKWLQPLGGERKQDVLEELSQASSPGFDYFLLVMLSCSIATFGLITDSAAVIIGAMLVAPLMSPILGLSLASVAGEQRMFRNAVIALVEGSVLAVILSALLGLIAGWLPLDIFKVLPGEILARTHPSPFDLGIGLAGGAAAAYALAQPRLSAALPGVAIATALMPPLCTAGIGIALANGSITLGAVLLFLTNLAAISFAGIMVFVAMGFRPRHLENTWHHIPRSLFISATLTLLITVPLIVLTLQVVKQARLNQEVRQAITAELASLPDAQLVNVNIDTTDSTLQLLVTIRTSRQPDYAQVVALQSAIAARLQRTTALQLIVVPTTKLDPLVPPTLTPTWVLTPTPTNTATLTSTPTATITNTPTLTFTPTPTFTATPVLAFIANTGGRGVYLFDAPAGAVIGTISESSPIHILYRREIINGQAWLEIRRADDRVGWVPAEYVIIRP
jgi:uncharacterized hydrophobic protein (TIGR00271 family)